MPTTHRKDEIEMKDIRTITTSGTSFAITLPKEEMDKSNFKAGEKVLVEIKIKKIKEL